METVNNVNSKPEHQVNQGMNNINTLYDVPQAKQGDGHPRFVGNMMTVQAGIARGPDMLNGYQPGITRVPVPEMRMSSNIGQPVNEKLSMHSLIPDEESGICVQCFCWIFFVRINNKKLNLFFIDSSSQSAFTKVPQSRPAGRGYTLNPHRPMYTGTAIVTCTDFKILHNLSNFILITV